MPGHCPDRAAGTESRPAARFQPRFTVAEVLRAAIDKVPRPALPAAHWKTLNALLRCRTDELGGHTYYCEDCGREHFVPHSCRNRHCPNCQRAIATDWLERESASLLPTPYFHVVFTLPHSLNPLIAQNQRALYNLLFNSASATLLEFGRRSLQAQIGVTAVLHSWGQKLLDHYHLHCLVTGGGLGLDGLRWHAASEDFLFSIEKLSAAFQEKFRAGLQKLHAKGQLGFHGQLAALADHEPFDHLLADACAKPWVVYCKKPFAGPETVLAYLSLYTHRVALGNGRILALDRTAGTVDISYRDYADESRRKELKLTLEEFLRRFCLHILPERFVKIRHYGLLGNRNRAQRIAQVRALIGLCPSQPTALAALPASSPPAEEPSPRVCPHCGSARVVLIARRKPLRSRSPFIEPALLNSS